MLLFLLKVTSIELIHFHPENQEIKHRAQVKQSNAFLQEAFPNSTSTARFFSQSKMHIYQYKENDRVIANLFVENTKYFFNDSSANLLIDPKKVNVLEIYSVVVDKDFRKKGLAAKLMRDAIDSMIKLYNLPKNTLIGLHLNPIDQMMGISFAFYCSLGFNKASIVEIGPSDFQLKAEKIFKLRSPVELALDILKGKIVGRYFAMFVEVDELKKVKVDMQVLVKTGKILQRLMLQVKDDEKEFL